MALPNENVNYITVSEIPSSLQRRVSYTAASLPEYIGHAVQGAGVGDGVWTIQKITYTASLETLKQTANGVDWTNRATASYT